MFQSNKGQYSIAICMSRLQHKSLYVQTLQCHRRSFLPAHQTTVAAVAHGGSGGAARTATCMHASACLRHCGSCRHQTNQANRNKEKMFMHRCIDVSPPRATVGAASSCWPASSVALPAGGSLSCPNSQIAGCALRFHHTYADLDRP